MTVAAKNKYKLTSTHRKRLGHHQRRSGVFMKAYWPYLPMALIVGVSILFNSLVMQPSVLSYATNTSPAGLLSSTNNERTQNGLSSLSLNNQLTLAAQAKANDMVARNYWSHNTPDGQEPWVFMVNAGYQYLAAGENLAYGFTNSEDTVIGWMNSPGHRANILNSNYQEVGFGIANSSDFQTNGEQTIVVAMYGKPAVASANTQTSSVPTPPPTTPAPVKTTPAPTPAPTEPVTPPPATQSEQPLAVEKDTSGDGNEDVTIAAVVPESQKVTRIQLATSGSAPWSIFAATAMMSIALIYLITRHSIAWHRAVVKGENFFLKHKFLDLVLVATIMLTAILSQTSGFIQ